MNEVQKTEWGEKRVYKTDDADESESQLEILQGGNGDWYVFVRYKDPEDGMIGLEGVRIVTSGQKIDGFPNAIAQAYRAIGGELPTKFVAELLKKARTTKSKVRESRRDTFINTNSISYAQGIIDMAIAAGVTP